MATDTKTQAAPKARKKRESSQIPFISTVGGVDTVFSAATKKEADKFHKAAIEKAVGVCELRRAKVSDLVARINPQPEAESQKTKTVYNPDDHI